MKAAITKLPTISSSILLFGSESKIYSNAEEYWYIRVALNKSTIPFKTYRAHNDLIKKSLKSESNEFPFIKKYNLLDINQCDKKESHMMIIPGEAQAIDYYFNKQSKEQREQVDQLIWSFCESNKPIMLCGLSSMIMADLLKKRNKTCLFTLGVKNSSKYTKEIDSLIKMGHKHADVDTLYSICDYENHIFCTPSCVDESAAPMDVYNGIRRTIERIKDVIISQSKPKQKKKVPIEKYSKNVAKIKYSVSDASKIQKEKKRKEKEENKIKK